jgi:hypothetical protein
VERTPLQLREAGQGLEVLEQGLGEGGELGAVADALEIGDEAAIGAGDDLPAAVAEDSTAFEDGQMLEKLFAVEVRYGPSFLRIHAPSENPETKINAGAGAVKASPSLQG